MATDESKVCKECGERKPLSEFYKNSKGAKGRVSRCRPCQRQHNRPLQVAYRQRGGDRGHSVRYRQQHPERAAAQTWLSNALRDGVVVKPGTCSRCRSAETRIEGHHPDYSKPQHIEWLCQSCHWKEHHATAA